MKSHEIARILHMLQNTYNGAAWHGASVMAVINKISATQAFHKSKHIHRICELVQHMITWRVFAFKRLEGDHKYEVYPNEDWKDFSNTNSAIWENVKKELEESQQNLLNSLSQQTDDLLTEKVEGKTYDYYTLIHGVIQHDLYHLGQIALLSKEINDMQ
jgi:uncharacterized damage-inducible protein DinB